MRGREAGLRTEDRRYVALRLRSSADVHGRSTRSSEMLGFGRLPEPSSCIYELSAVAMNSQRLLRL